MFRRYRIYAAFFATLAVWLVVALIAVLPLRSNLHFLLAALTVWGIGTASTFALLSWRENKNLAEALETKHKELKEQFEQKQRELEESFEVRLKEEVIKRTRDLNAAVRIVRDILDSIPSGLIVVNSEHTILLANLSAYKIFDAPPDGLKLANMNTVLPESVCNAISEVLKNQEIKLDDEVVVGTGNSSRILKMSVLPLKGSNRRALAVFDDITERRKLEQELRIREKMSSLGTLVAGVAHEINNPLNAIVGLVELLLRKYDLPPEPREYLEKTKEYVYRIAAIVQDLNRYTQNARVAEFVLSDLNSTVASAVEIAKRANPQFERIELDAVFPLNLPPVKHNPSEISQVVINLINNAVDSLLEKAKQAGNGFVPRLRVYTKVEQEKEGKFVAIIVEDNGVGFSEDIKNKLFDPFFSTKFNGSGLGLALSLRMVQDHGGKIVAESEPNSFARFKVLLPV